MNYNFKPLMLKANTKDRLGELTKDLGKMSYTQLIEFLLDFYHKNK